MTRIFWPNRAKPESSCRSLVSRTISSSGAFFPLKKPLFAHDHSMHTPKFIFLSCLLMTLTPPGLLAQPHDLVPATIAPVSPLVMARPHAEWLGQAQLLERQRNWNALLELGRQWSQAESGKALAWFVLGRAASELGRHDEAIAAYERALRIEPDDIYSINNLGNAYRDSGRPRQAMHLWREAVKINPGYLQAWNNLGTTFYAIKGQAGVVQALQQLQATDPVLAEVWRKLAIEYSISRDERVARQAVGVLRGLSEAQRTRMFDILFAGV
jgi:predicted O-linked N-acetylglucosamine transferase (SPINDLY family)